MPISSSRDFPGEALRDPGTGLGGSLECYYKAIGFEILKMGTGVHLLSVWLTVSGLEEISV